MSRLAVVDATHHTEDFAPTDPVAGLAAVVRATKLAGISGATTTVVVARATDVDSIDSVLSDADLETEFEIQTSRSDSLDEVVTRAESQFEQLDESETESVMYLRSTTFGFRDIPGELAESAESSRTIAWLDIGGVKTQPGDFFAASRRSWRQLCRICDDASVQTVGDAVDALESDADGQVLFERPLRSWQMRVSSRRDAERAGDQIWEDCRKPTDGPVSRYLNRYVSMAVSRRLARTGIKPNQVSIVALFVAMASAPFAVMGGYWGFLGATLVYKLNSIIDGIDGELSRGKYDFSDLGAWLDKFCDDCADLFWFVGSGIGAWATGVPDPLGIGPEFWLWIIGIFLTGKALCSVSFYSIPFREGELVHPYRSLDWWFEDDDGGTKEGVGDKIAGFFKVLTGNDVFVGISLVFAIVGALPWFLIIMGVGQVFVGIGRTYQIQKQWGKADQETAAATAGE